jgi:hypothetical protein
LGRRETELVKGRLGVGDVEELTDRWGGGADESMDSSARRLDYKVVGTGAGSVCCVEEGR